jgi:hypothetical protein
MDGDRSYFRSPRNAALDAVSFVPGEEGKVRGFSAWR